MNLTIKNKERLVKPSDLPDVETLDLYIKELDKKYGVDSTDKDNSFGCLSMDTHLVSHLYESNIYYFLFGYSSDINHIPKTCQTPIPHNTILTAAYGNPTLPPQIPKQTPAFGGQPLVMSEQDKSTLIGLRTAAYDSLKAAYPKQPIFEDADDTPEKQDDRLEAQGFASGRDKMEITVQVRDRSGAYGPFSVSYKRLSANKCPDFTMSYNHFQNQDDMPSKSLAYQFYKKWVPFHLVAMTKAEYEEMCQDAEELAAYYKRR